MKNVIRTIVSTVCVASLAWAAAQPAAHAESIGRQSVASTQSQATGHGRSTSVQVKADLRSAQRFQSRGDLTAARNSAIRAWIGAGIAHSIPTTSRSLNPVLLFPEGDALHFFAWNTATELVYIDLSHDSVKLAWRASLEPAGLACTAASTKSSAPYAFVREEALLHEDGTRPAITTPLVFFEVEYNEFGGLLYGRVTQSGYYVALGRGALTWRYYDGEDGTGSKRAITRVRGQWLAWSKVCSIPGERDGFAKLDRQPVGPVAVSNAGRAFARLAHQYFAKGDLTAARNAALAAWGHAGIPGSVAGYGDALLEYYLFPEWQALRFFDWNPEGRITYIEIRGDSVALVWAADLVGSDRRFVFTPKDERMVPWPSNLMPHFPYKFDAGSRITLEVGHGPDIDGALVFFGLEYATGGMPFGRVKADGSIRPSSEAPLKFSDHHYDVVPIPGEHIAAPVERAPGKTSSSQPSNGQNSDARVSRTPLTILKGHTNVIFSVAFSHNGKQLATVSADDSTSIWDTTSWTQLSLQGASAFGPLAFSPDDKVLPSRNGNLWDTLTGQTLDPPRVGNGISAVAFSPDGSMLATGSIDGTAQLLDVRSGKLLWTHVDTVERIESLAFSPDGRLLATGDAYAKTMIWAVQAREVWRARLRIAPI